MKNIFISKYMLIRFTGPHGDLQCLNKPQNNKVFHRKHFPAFEVYFCLTASVIIFINSAISRMLPPMYTKITPSLCEYSV